MLNKKRVIAGLLAVSLVASSGTPVLAKNVSKSKESINYVSELSKEKSSIMKNVDSIVSKYIEDEIIPSAVVMAIKDDKVLIERSYGNAQVYGDIDFTDIDNPVGTKLSKARKAKKDTLYDLASVTKVVATTQAIMKLYYEGKLDVNDKVVKYIPEFGKNGKEDVTIEQLLTHTSGMPQWVPSFLHVNNDRKEELEFINNLSLIFEPGTLKYSDFGFMTLGYIVEAISGKNLDDYVEDEIYKPIGMNNTMYNPLRKGVKKDKIAATSWGNPFEYRMVDEVNYPGFGYDTTEYQDAFKTFDGWRKEVLVGLVNDGNAGMANDGIAGHAGVFSTANDLAKLGQLMLNGGVYNGVRLYDQETIDLFTKNHLPEHDRGYGFELNMSYMGEKQGLNSYGHNGFTGTHFTVDPENNMVIIVLTNKQNLGLNESGSYPSTFKLVNEISTAIQNSVVK